MIFLLRRCWPATVGIEENGNPCRATFLSTIMYTRPDANYRRINKEESTMQPALPTINELTTGTWSLIEQHFQELEARVLTAESVADWLSDWSRLSKLVGHV